MTKQELEKLKEKYIVLENEEDYKAKFYVTLRRNFEKTILCDTYDRYGIKLCHSEVCGEEYDEDGNELPEEERTHVEVIAWNYWDGSNWKSIILDNKFEDNFGWCEADEKDIESVLSELPSTPYIDGINETIETENHEYFYSRYADFQFLCVVDPL